MGGLKHVQFKLAFVEQERGLPSLSRGWRTPDPSPTRNAGRALPRCAPVVEVISDAEPGRDFGVAVPIGDTTDIPQPEVDAERLLVYAHDKYFNLGVWENRGYGYDPSYSFTSPHCFEEISRSRAQVESGYVVEKPAPVINLSMAIPFVEDVVEPKKVMFSSGPMSFGSLGHPHACSEPCKYVLKKNGCKDGVNCDRCHFCQWKRSGKRRPRGQTSFVPGTCSPCTQ